MQINKTSPIPRFLQLADILEKTIVQISKRTNRTLPPIEVLSKQYEVSKATVNKAIQILTEKGLLYSEAGRGTFLRAECNKNIVKKIVLVEDTSFEWEPLGSFMRASESEIKKQCNINGLDYVRQTLGTKGALKKYLEADNFESTGHIFTGLSDASEPLRSLLDKKQIPYATVLATEKASLPDHVYKIPVDEVNAVRLSLRHLIKLGHTHIAFIGHRSEAEFSPSRIRYEIVQNTLTRYEVPFTEKLFVGIGSNPSSRIRGYKAVEHLLKQKIPFTAIVTSCDLLATGAILCLKDHGKRIPEDVSVVGLGNNLYSRHFVPPLTTLAINYSELGHRSFCAITRNEHASVIKFKLIPRESSASPLAPLKRT
ncbi:MAG: GntR family transcriptional regulator [Kiritimatiellales bacterium]